MRSRFGSRKSNDEIIPSVYRVNSNGDFKVEQFGPETIISVAEELMANFADRSKILSAADNKYHVLLYGGSGSGKTSTINVLEQTIVESGQFDKIYRLDFSNLNNEAWAQKYGDLFHSNRLACFIHNFDPTHSKKAIPTEVLNIDKLFYNKKILLIVDGYNKAFVQHNLMLDEVFKFKNIILTARSLSDKIQEHNFELYLKQGGFNEAQIKAYIARDLGDKSAKLIDYLIKFNELKEIIKNPYLLKIICNLWLRYDDLITYNKYKLTISVLFEDIVYSIFGQYVKDVEGRTDEYELTSVAIQNHPLMSLLQEKAFNAKFGISDSSAVDRYRDEILSRIPAESSIKSISQALYKLGIVNFRPNNKLGSSFEFYNEEIKEFLVAGHLRNMLISSNPEQIASAGEYISLNAIKTEYLLTFKLLSGLILNIKDLTQRVLAQDTFWKAVVNNDGNIVKIHGDYSIKLLMHLLSQTIKSDSLIPEAPLKIARDVNEYIFKDFASWSRLIMESQYFSNDISAFLKGDSDEARARIIQVLPFVDHDFPKLIDILRYEITTDHNILSIYNVVAALKRMSSNHEAIEMLSELAGGQHKFSQLVAIQALGEIASDKYVNSLLQLLNSDEVVIVLLALESLKNHRSSYFYNEIIEALFLKMSQHGENKDIIVNKCLETFQSFGITLKMLEKMLLDRYDPYKDNTSIYMSALTNIYDQKLEFREVEDQDQIYKIWNSQFKLTWGHKVSCKGRIVELLSFKYDHLSSELGDSFFQWIIGRFSPIYIPSIGGGDQSVKNAMLDAIGNMYHHLKPEQKVQAFEVLTSRRGVESRVAAVGNYHKIINDLDASQIELLQTKIKFKLVNNELPRLREKMLDELDKIKSSIVSESFLNSFFANIITHFLIRLGANPGKEEENIKILGKLSSLADTASNEHLLDVVLGVLHHNLSAVINYASLGAIKNFVSVISEKKGSLEDKKINQIYLSMKSLIDYAKLFISTNERAPQDKKVDISKELDLQKNAYEVIGYLLDISEVEERSISLIEFLSAILEDSQSSSEVKSFAIIGLTKGINKISSEKFVSLLDFLLEISSGNSDFYLPAIEFIYKAKLNNVIDQEKTLEIVEFLSGFSINQEIKNAQNWALLGFIKELSYAKQDELFEFIINERIKHSSIVSNTKVQHYLREAYDLLLSQVVEMDNPRAQQLISALFVGVELDKKFFDEFIEKEISKKHDVKKIDILSNLKTIFTHNEEVFVMLDQELDKLKTPSSDIYDEKHLIELIEKIKTPEALDRHLDIAFTSDGTVFVDGRKAASLKPNYVRAAISALKDVTTIHSYNKKSNHYSLIDGKKLSDKMLKVSILRTSGEESILIAEEVNDFDKHMLTEYQKIDGEFNTEVFEDVDAVTRESIFGAPSESKAYHYSTESMLPGTFQIFLKKFQLHGSQGLENAQTGEISQNDLLGLQAKIFSSLDKISRKLDKVGANVDSHYKHVESQLEKLNLKADITQKLISDLDAFKIIDSPKGLNSYQKSLYIAIVKQLMANYLMAVTLTYEPDTLLGRAGALFGIVGEFVPVAGPGLKFLGIIADSIAKIHNAKIIENIANIAITPSAMEKIARGIAEIFVKGKINFDNFPDQNSIIGLIKEVIDSASIEAISDKIVSLCADVTAKSSADNDAALGEEHAMLIVNNVIMPFISAGNLAPQTDSGVINLVTVKNYVYSHSLVEIELQPEPLKVPLILEVLSENDLMRLDQCVPGRLCRSKSKDLSFNSPKLVQDDSTSTYRSLIYRSLSDDNLLVRNPSSDSGEERQRYDDLFISKGHVRPSDHDVTLPEIVRRDSNPIQIGWILDANQDYEEDSPVGDVESPRSKKPSLEIPASPDNSYNIALTGAGILNFANSIPAIKYLSKHYIPVMPYIDKAYDYLGLTDYSNGINTAIYAGGALLIGCSVGQCYAVLPYIGGYYLKPYVYKARDKILEQIKKLDFVDDSTAFEVAKLFTYIGTDIVLTAAISSPLTPLDESITMSSALWGAGMGAASYFDQNVDSSSVVNKLAFATTTAAGAATIYKLGNPKNIILNFPAIPSSMFVAHYLTKVVGGWGYGYFYPIDEQNENEDSGEYIVSTSGDEAIDQMVQ